MDVQSMINQITNTPQAKQELVHKVADHYKTYKRNPVELSMLLIVAEINMLLGNRYLLPNERQYITKLRDEIEGAHEALTNADNQEMDMSALFEDDGEEANDG